MEWMNLINACQHISFTNGSSELLTESNHHREEQIRSQRSQDGKSMARYWTCIRRQKKKEGLKKTRISDRREETMKE